MSLDQSNCPSSLRLFISDEDLLALANDDVGFWCRYVGLTLSDSKRGGGAARCCKRKRAAPVRPPLRMRRLSETRNIALPPCTSPDGACGQFSRRCSTSPSCPLRPTLPTLPLPTLVPLLPPPSAHSSSSSKPLPIQPIRRLSPALPDSSNHPPAAYHPPSPSSSFSSLWRIDSPRRVDSTPTSESAMGVLCPCRPPSRSTIFFCDSPESCSTLSSLLPSLPPSPVRPAFLSAFATLNTADDPSHDLMGLDGAFPSSATHGLLRTGEVAKSRRWLLKQLPEHVVVEHVHYRLASWVENQKGRKAKGREGQA